MSTSSDSPKITVVMPVYNTEKYLRQAIESILNQDYTNFVFAIVDDCSKDGSYEICQEYARKDSRIQLSQNEVNSGYIHSLNTAIARANTEFIARMDSDDICMPTRLSKQLELITASEDIVLVGSQIETIDEDDKLIRCMNLPTGTDSLDDWQMTGRGTAVCHPSALYRKSAFDRVGGYNKEFYPAEDFHMWLQYAELGKIVNHPEVLVHYRVHKNSVSQKNRQIQEDAIWRGIQTALQRRNIPLEQVDIQTLPRDEKTSWIQLAIKMQKFKWARTQSLKELKAYHDVPSIKLYVKTLLADKLPQTVQLYNKFLYGK